MEIKTEAPPLYGKKVLCREIPSNIEEKNKLIEEILQILEEANFLDEDEKVWARLCLDEVLVNAIKHGNKEDHSKVVKVSLFMNEKLWAIRVEDEGDGFSSEDVPDVECEESWELEHGRGLLLMKKYMDEIWYYNNGTSVQMKKVRKSLLKKILDKIQVLLKLKQF